MQLFNPTLLLALATSAVAYQIPTDLPDGSYSVTLNANGTGWGKPVPLDVKEIKTPHKGRMEITSRALPGASTGCNNYGMSTENTRDAQNNFRAGHCENGWLAPNSVRYSKVGSAVAYMCNYGDWNPCGNGEYSDAVTLFDTVCGRSRASWVDIPTWKKVYGRANVGVQICGWFTSS